jgi:hypothetical protein
MLRVLVGMALAAMLAAGCGGGQEHSAVEDVTEYVGAVSGIDPAVPERGRYVVAVAIAADGKVVAYACDGLGSSVSLTGTERDGRLDLRTGDGAARLRAALRGSVVAGTVTVAGSTQAFTAARQEGVGGLYALRVALSPDERALTIVGVSERGNRLRATVEAGRAAPLTLSFTLLDGSGRTVRLGAAHPSARLGGFDGYRLAFLDGGFGRGNPARGSTRLVPATPLGDSLLPVTGFLPPATIDR